MATENDSKLSYQQEVESLAQRVMEIAARMAGFKPLLDSAQHDVDQETGNTLALLAGAAGYMQDDLMRIGEQLSAMQN